jgi:hypothetical protein
MASQQWPLRTLLPSSVGLPIACPHLAELFADYQKKVMDKTVKTLHDPPPTKSGKPAYLLDDDDTDSLSLGMLRTGAKYANVYLRSRRIHIRDIWGIL